METRVFRADSKGRVEGTFTSFSVRCSKNLEKLKTHLKKSNLFILPLKPDSPLVGAEALSTVAAGVPILVSSRSGIASVLKTIIQDESVVKEASLESDEETWKDRMLQKLFRPEESQRRANQLREELLLDTSIAQTQLNFIGTVVGKKLKMCS